MNEATPTPQTEAEMREAQVPAFENLDQLQEYIQNLVGQQHDYGTCVYAMSMAATAAYNFVAAKLGVTGFQASCADLDILRRTRGFEWGKIVDFENLLYPQYVENSEHWPTPDRLYTKPEVAKELASRAAELLKSGVGVPEVRNHWKMLTRLPAAK